MYSDVVETVRTELRIQIQKAIDAGIPRWNILVDPGIGIKSKICSFEVKETVDICG